MVSQRENTDPALSQDQLPQPYRMIWKVLDEYILDPAWLEITRLHPELLQDADGEAFARPHNQALQNICTPSSVTEQAHGGTSIVEQEGLLFMATDGDAFCVIDPTDGKIVQSIMLEEPAPVKTAEELAAEAAAAAAAAADPKAKKGKSAEAPAPGTANAHALARKASCMWISSSSQAVTAERVLTFAVCSIVTLPEEVEQEVVDAKGKARLEMVLKQVPKLKVLAVQATLGTRDAFRPSLIRLRVAGECSVALSEPSTSAFGPADVSPDGRLLCLTTSLGVTLYRLPDPQPTQRTTVGQVETLGEVLAEEDEAQGDSDASSKDVPILPVLVQLKASEFFQGKVPKQTILFPLVSRVKVIERAERAAKVALAAEVPPAVPVPAPVLPRYDMALCVLFRDAKVCLLCTLGGLTADGRPGAEDPDCKNVHATELLRWRLTAPATAVCADADRAALVIGMQDGSLCLYNLVGRCLTSVLAKHEAAVSALAFSQTGMAHGSQAQHFIVSGAEDGTVCMFHLRLPRSPQHTTPVGAMVPVVPLDADETAALCISTAFQTFRLDVNAGVRIVGIRSMGDFSWAAVQCSDGMTLVYDVLAQRLLGRLALYSGMISRQVAWKVCTFRESTLTLPLPPVPSVGQQDDLGYDISDAAAAAAAAAAGGGGGGVSGSASSLNSEKKNKELTDPNAFVRMPPAKRAAKYAVSTDLDVALIVTANSIATGSSFGYHAMYLRNGLPVLALFKTDDLFVNFYPEIAALLSTKAAYAIDKASFFKKLTRHERTDVGAAAQKISSDFDVYGDGASAGGRGRAASIGTGRGSRRGTTTPGGVGASGGITATASASASAPHSAGQTPTGSRKNSRAAGSSQTALTRKNVEALQTSLGTTAAGQDNEGKGDGRIISMSYERIVEPVQAAARSAQSSSMDRQIRKNRLANRLDSISSMF